MLFYLSLIDTEEEKSKFEQLYHLYRYTMLHVAVSILKETQLAEDAVHEAFIRIAKNLHKIGEVSSPQTKGFVVIIVKNISLTMLKKESPNMEYLDAHEVDYLEARIHVEEECLNKLLLEQVVSAVRRLPEKYRDILYLYLVGEYSIGEIAKMLRLPKETVKKRIQRGRKMVITTFQQEGVDLHE